MAAAQDFFTTMRNFSARLTTGVTATDGTGSLTSPTWWSADGTADGIVAAGDIVTEAAVQTAAVRHAYEIDNRSTAVVSNARTYEFGD